MSGGPESEVLLEVRGLSIRSTERTLFEDVSITVRSGRITAVVGHSGSGKSVSARAAMGVVDVEPGLVSGSLRYPALTGDQDWFEGVRGQGLAAQRRLAAATAHLRGGYVTYSPQSASSALNPGRTIGRQLELCLARRDHRPDDPRAEIARILAEVGLPARAGASLPSELSGGMAQRAALAVAIAPNPRVLIADEPETGLDPVLRRVVTELLLAVAMERKAALLLISHNMDTVARIAHDVVRIGVEGGKTPAPAERRGEGR